MRFCSGGVPPSLMALTLPALHGSVATAGGTFATFAGTVRSWQENMVAQAKALDPASQWTIDEHAKGRAIVVEDGDVFEKGCVSITLIEDGELSAARASAISARSNRQIAAGDRYSACALSFVLHARSPLVPTLRGDVRCFTVGSEEWWGGGLDLTPSYVEVEDCVHFHSSLARLCASHSPDPGTYAEMKRTCDDYFYLPARGEHRGVGGIFFDDLASEWAPPFARALIDAALDEDGPYVPIVRKRRPLEYTDAQKQWQYLRRGRYVEFNLLYDRGVKFGLTPESVERVLVSSPPMVAFKYKAIPADGTSEAATLEVLRRPKQWVES